jgi:hypothetical protein
MGDSVSMASANAMDITRRNEMLESELVERQVRDPEQLRGKTIRTIEEDGTRAVIAFTDGTFTIIDPNPENDGCGLCLDGWWTRSPGFVRWLKEIMENLANEHEETQEPDDIGS